MIKIKTVKVVTIDDEDYPVIFEFPVLWRGWELDDVGYIIEYDDKNRLIWSDHGEFKLISNTEPESITESITSSPLDVSILTNFIKKYKSAIDNTEYAINLLTE